jgi:hypothetical protein
MPSRHVIKGIIMSSVAVYLVTSEPFFFPFFLSSPKTYSIALVVIDVSTSVLIFFIGTFLSRLFCKSFQFHHFNPNLPNIIFFNFVYIIWIFFLGSSVNVLLVFNFIIQLKLMVLCFPI